MLWYIVMALIGGWLVGWTTRGIIDRHLDFKVGIPSTSTNTQSTQLCEDCDTNPVVFELCEVCLLNKINRGA